MQFDTAAYLRKATSRAKSDVANKLVSMLLHEISRRIVAVGGQSVTDPAYTQAVALAFGDRCGYCQRVLEPDRTSVEHLDGMNRFRVGLHVPGNVILACKRCNTAKRQDDQLDTLRLAESGWESFLAHDGSECASGCKACSYWRNVWPEDAQRTNELQKARLRIQTFRAAYVTSGEWAGRTREVIKERIHALYRECQASAKEKIETMATELFEELGKNPVRL